MTKNKGITLIALVITIIVLLILAGISIATLTGENGLLTKATTAKRETKTANAEEQVKIAVTGSLDNEGKLTANKVKEELGKIPNVGKIRDTNGGFPIEVDLDEYTFVIDGNGNVIRKATKPVIDYSLSTEKQVAEGTEVTVTITATIGEKERITKITKQGKVIATNTGTATFTVTTSGVYTVTAEGSNGETTTKKITITNIGTTEIFSDIYTETQTYTDSNNKTAKIPEGFAVGISSTINKIDNGLVITDEIDENHKSTGNEFVWIPVENETDFKRVEGYSNGDKQSFFSNYSEPYKNGSQEEKDLYAAMYHSVTNPNNKGFYMGRYEAGKENNKVVVKKNQTVYNYVSWGNNSLTDLNGGAVQYAKEFTNDKSYREKVTSTLVYGVQWDATMQFLDNSYIKGTPSTSSYVRDSSKKGWYVPEFQNFNSGNMDINTNHITGKDLIYSNKPEETVNKRKNIYDMAGNVEELTMEAYCSNVLSRVRRGGYYSLDGKTFSASARNYSSTMSPREEIGFRLALYF